MRAVVVGAGGFLGSRLAERLVQNRSEVHGTWFMNQDRLPAGLASRTHVKAISTAGLPSPDAVFVCAAHVPYGAMQTACEALEEANVRLPEQCLSWFPRARIVFASSVAVLGDAPSPRTESTAPEASDAYGLSKRQGEIRIGTHPSFAIVRFASLYGPRMTAPTFLPAIARDARARRLIRLLGDGRRTQDYLFVDDAADMMIAASRYPANGVFLGASGVAVSNLHAARTVASMIPGTEIVFEGEDESRSVSYDPAWTFRELRFAPAVAFEDGVRRMVDGE